MGQPSHNRLLTTKRDAAKGFGETLRAERIKRGLIQLDLGELIGIIHSIVARWEFGARSPTRAHAERLAEVLSDEVMIAAGYLPAGYIAVKQERTS